MSKLSNGVVAVTSNSTNLTLQEASLPEANSISQACADAFLPGGALARIGIDCRADNDGVYRIFDINIKPNMMCSGRPGHDNQDSLFAIAARAFGRGYVDLLTTLLEVAQRMEKSQSSDD